MKNNRVLSSLNLIAADWYNNDQSAATHLTNDQALVRGTLLG
jgi:hypothetical protein